MAALSKGQGSDLPTPPVDPNFSGPEYEPKRDHERLKNQHERVRDLMLDGAWRTIREIARATGDPENSVQAQLRHLRKPRFGGYIVDKETIGGVLWGYRVRERTAEDPPYQGGKSAKAQSERADAMEALLERALAHMAGGSYLDRLMSDTIRGRLDGL